jgi:hypothetical protein
MRIAVRWNAALWGRDNREELAPLSAVYPAAGAALSIEPQRLTDEIVAERLTRSE